MAIEQVDDGAAFRNYFKVVGTNPVKYAWQTEKPGDFMGKLRECFEKKTGQLIPDDKVAGTYRFIAQQPQNLETLGLHTPQSDPAP
jgi:hypothetical protein